MRRIGEQPRAAQPVGAGPAGAVLIGGWRTPPPIASGGGRMPVPSVITTRLSGGTPFRLRQQPRVMVGDEHPTDAIVGDREAVGVILPGNRERRLVGAIGHREDT